MIIDETIRRSEFEPQIVKKLKKDISGLERRSSPYTARE